MASVPDESETSALIALVSKRRTVNQQLAEAPHDKAMQRSRLECEQAMARLVTGHYGLIVSLGYKAASGLAQNGITPDDVRQAAVVGFLRGIERYDPERGKLSTYIWFWIREAVWHTCRDAMGFSGHWGNDLYWSLHSLVSSAEQSTFEMSHEDIADMWNRSVVAERTAKIVRQQNVVFEDAYKQVIADKSLKKTLLTPRRVAEILRAGETVDYLDVYDPDDETPHRDDGPISDSAEDDAIAHMRSAEVVNAISELLSDYAVHHGQVIEFLRFLFGIERERLSITAAAKAAGLGPSDAMAEMAKFLSWARQQKSIIKLRVD